MYRAPTSSASRFNSNQFSMLSDERMSQGHVTKLIVNKNNNVLLNNIKKMQQDENDCVCASSTDVNSNYLYPMVQLTSWYGTQKKPLPPIFDLKEDEECVGPEMRRIYTYLEKEYLHNLHHNSQNKYDIKNEYNIEDECETDNGL